LTKIKRNKTKNIVFSARLVKSKGIVEFIKAAIKLKKTYPEWNFHIYGASDYKSNDNFYLNNFKDEIKKRIIEYKGYTTNLNSILKNSEIFCLPSYREGMPKSILEATAVGIPCVVSNAVGIKESIINNKTGLLFKNKDYKDLARKISYLIDNPKKRREFSKRGKLFVKEFASIKNVTKKIFHIYELQK
jgi:glycosyltransferase involved in cell wall biosynthesis